MSLSIVNNVASLTAQYNLNQTSSSLNQSLQRLSTGLKINSGADGPAALVISEETHGQVAGLQTALDNTSQAVNMVQTAEGSLNEINSLPTHIRGLALDSANTGVNDANALAANQAQFQNALSTINQIVNTTQFGGSKLFANDSSNSLSSLPVAPSSPADYAMVVAAYTSQPVADFSKLSSVDVSSAQGAQNALGVIDQAISDVSNLRAQLGAFQSNTLQANATNLQTTLQNTTAANSTVRDTNYAAETAKFTQLQVQLQAGVTLLSSANQTSGLILKLLQGA